VELEPSSGHLVKVGFVNINKSKLPSTQRLIEPNYVKQSPAREKEMTHPIESPAVDVFSLPPPFLTNITSIGELRKPCLTRWVCVCRGKVGSERGERGKTEWNTYTNYFYAVVNLTQLMIGRVTLFS
jgi:hypothetical protein